MITAILVALVSIFAFATRSDDVVSWVFLGPTVAAFGLRASLGTQFRGWWVLITGLWVPVVLNLIESDMEISMFIVIISTMVLSATCPNRTPMHIGLTLYTFTFVTLGVTDAINDFAWPNWAFGILFGWGSGELIWRLENTVDELEDTRALVADQAALQERRRIARDVHDLVGHSLSVVLLHVTGARHLLHSDPAEAERALEQAEAAGRQSLTEIRRTVGLLRDASDGAPEILPSSDLTDIDALVDEFFLAGLDTSLRTTGSLDAVDPAIGLAGYRIVQEALTNASRHRLGAEAIVEVVVTTSRHRLGAEAIVEVVVTTDACDISIVNTGGTLVPHVGGPGFGLIGMRERARSIGGSLLAGPEGDGWRVEANLPTRVAVRTSTPIVKIVFKI